MMNTELKDKAFLASAILFIVIALGGYLALDAYLSYFFLVDKFRFSFALSMIFFLLPVAIYFLYLILFSAIKNKLMKFKNNIMIYLIVFSVLGGFFSLFFSNYVEKDLLSKGYFICEKSTFAESNLYVRSLKMCH